jgi:predicted TIM-barrel fold metal-dependent hydrolase
VIIDFHTHIFPPWLRDHRERYVDRDATFRELFSDPKARIATAEELVQAMDEDGVDVAVVMGIGWADQGLAREVNDYVIESVGRFGDRLAGFAGVSPAWGDDAAREADRCAVAGLKGVGELHPDPQGFDLGDRDIMAPVLEVVRQHGLIVTTHSSEPVGHLYQGKGKTRPEVLWRFVQSCPDVTVVCAHWGGGLPFYALMPEVLDGLGNVYFDTAASPFLYAPGVFPVVASLVGADRVLLGSDYPLMHARRVLEQVEGSSLSQKDKSAIVGGNAAKLLGYRELGDTVD